jgi:hypothetical protein
MQRLFRTLTLLVAAMLASAGPLHGQEQDPPESGWEDDEERPRRLDISLAAGRLLSSDWSDLVVLGTLGGLVERVLVRDLAFAPGAAVDVAITYWEGRYGFRVHAGMARSCVAIGGNCDAVPVFLGGADGATLIPGDIDAAAWLLDIGGAVSLVRPGYDRDFRPFVFFGLGGVAYDLDGAVRLLLPTFIELGGEPGRIALDPDGNVIVVAGGSPFLVSVAEPGFEVMFAGVLGIGADVRIPVGDGTVGLRFELADHVTRSPLDVRLAGFVDDFHLSRRDVEDVRFDFGAVHNLRLNVGLVVDAPLGGGRPAEAE